jgi:hypothetical protein
MFSTRASIGQGGSVVATDPVLRNASFCLGGALVRAEEMTVVSTDGGRTYSLTGNVTLRMPAR